jgi:hypothetical protein
VLGQYNEDLRQQSMLHNLDDEQRRRLEERKQREAGQDHVVLPPSSQSGSQPSELANANEDVDVLIQRQRSQYKGNACWYLILFMLFALSLFKTHRDMVSNE